ncbi:MAG: helix-turn-helix domain-containing protein [Candidatus Nanosynbacter sp.]|nr:helix-turn-helix domain-containing protein [Candidatus Nanosynbacter sp.]
MAYCIAKSIEIQRSKALKEIFLEGRSVAQVARRFGRNRSTLYRWIKRWREINNYPDFRNYLLSKLLEDYNYSRESRKGSGTQ